MLKCMDVYSLPEFMDLKRFGKTILVANKQFRFLFGPSTQEVSINLEPPNLRFELVWRPGATYQLKPPMELT